MNMFPYFMRMTNRLLFVPNSSVDQEKNFYRRKKCLKNLKCMKNDIFRFFNVLTLPKATVSELKFDSRHAED